MDFRILTAAIVITVLSSNVSATNPCTQDGGNVACLPRIKTPIRSWQSI